MIVVAVMLLAPRAWAEPRIVVDRPDALVDTPLQIRGGGGGS
jgi:hypothetical protein